MSSTQYNQIDDLIEELKRLSTLEYKKKLARFGIEDSNALGVKIPDIRKLAKIIGKNHALALQLWETEVHEAHLLASMIADASQLSENDFDEIVRKFDSWHTCDQTCDLLSTTPFAENKITEYADNEYVFIKRTAFVLMCYFAVHFKKKPNEFFYPFLILIEKQA